jgi:excisionase family DNA binding protein
MTTNVTILGEPSEIKNLIKEALSEHRVTQVEADTIKLYSINEVAKKLGMAHRTIKRLVIGGAIKATKDGRITQEALNEYLGKI